MPFVFTFFIFTYSAAPFHTVDTALLKIIFLWHFITLLLPDLLIILFVGSPNLSLKCTVLYILSIGLLFSFTQGLSQQFSNFKLVTFKLAAYQNHL